MPSSERRNRLVKAWTGRTYDQHVRHGSWHENASVAFQAAASGYPLRELGWAADAQMFLTEEARESHLHILGAPGQGKSKFLELLIRQDIDRGYGCCLLDPNRGDTVYSVLRYCAKIGHDKVLLIDP